MKNIKFILIACCATSFGLLPLSWSQEIGRYLGRLMITVNKKRRHIALCNLKACFPEQTEAQHQLLLNKVVAEAGKWFMESAYVWFRRPDYLVQRTFVKNPQVLKAAFEKGRGLLLYCRT
jgi:KDO2-lipid IV(A) lauroyltransferase